MSPKSHHECHEREAKVNEIHRGKKKVTVEAEIGVMWSQAKETYFYLVLEIKVLKTLLLG
jgi:hypothetical protein